MKDVLNIVFINKSTIINSEEIQSILVPSEKEKLNNLIEVDHIIDPIVIPGTLINEDENGEQIDAVFLFSVLDDDNIDCVMLFKAIKNMRHFCLENNVKFSFYDEYSVEIEDLQGLKSYITNNEINNLLNILLSDI